MVIHYQLLAWAALGFATIAWFVAGSLGRRLAVVSLGFGLPALALYSVTLAVFALLIAGLRLVRSERHSAKTSRHDTAAQARA